MRALWLIAERTSSWKGLSSSLKVLSAYSLVQAVLIDDGFQTHKCIYNIAYAYYKLGKLHMSRINCERLLKLDPLNEEAQELHQQLDSIVQQSKAVL